MKRSRNNRNSGGPGVTKRRSARTNLLITPGSNWFDIPQPAINNSASSIPNISPDKIHHLDELHKHAESLLEAENEAFEASQPSSSSRNFYSTVIVSGTLSDKISALTLAVQESPIHNVKALDTLINLGKKRSRAQAVDVLSALKDLFAQGSLLPSGRKLHTFSAHPIIQNVLSSLNSKESIGNWAASIPPQHLIICAFEGWLKVKYFEILQLLEIWCNDEIEFSKAKAVRFVFELLKEKPEQESNLLRLLTNKLGDPIKKIASQASYLLMGLMAAHPLMKATIISGIESDLLFRPGQSLHAKYYATITLNQTVLSGKEEDLASKLLDLYFGLFVGLLKPAGTTKTGDVHDLVGRKVKEEGKRGKRGRKKEACQKYSDDFEDSQVDDLREKLISAILTGINRAYPYTGSQAQSLPAHVETLFKVTHSSNFNTSIQALMLIQQLCSSHQASEDRFYRALYESLLDARLVTSSKHSLYLNLLYRALTADTNVRRVTAFVKRIFQLLNLHQPPFICGCFFLIQKLRRQFPGLSALIDQPEDHSLDGATAGKTQETIDLPRLSQDLSTNGNREIHIYDSRKRDPEHSNAENTCMWEVIPFLAHFHPSISVNAEHLIEDVQLPGKPDLELHTLMHFLDRFVYRNAKIGGSKPRGSSIMQPLFNGDSAGVLVSAATHPQLPVNSERFWASKRESVAPEDAFFHQYFNSLSRAGQQAKTKTTSQKSINNSDDEISEDDESEIWKAMMGSAPDLERTHDSDQELDMSDLDSAMEVSAEEADGTDETDEGGSPQDATWLDHEPSPESHVQSALPVPKDDELGIDIPMKSQKGVGTRRRKLKHLPTFASASDYAAMINDEIGEDQG